MGTRSPTALYLGTLKEDNLYKALLMLSDCPRLALQSAQGIYTIITISDLRKNVFLPPTVARGCRDGDIRPICYPRGMTPNPASSTDSELLFLPSIKTLDPACMGSRPGSRKQLPQTWG